jgi:two-component sensor histidine kinase
MPATLDPLPEKDIASVFITDALARRLLRASDPGAEKHALLMLAATMAQSPAEILPRLVKLALLLTGSASAGLSLFEMEPAPGVLRWRHVCGRLTPFEDLRTPRNNSPCGVALDRNEPTLASRPERAYPWIAEAGIVLPEMLLVPLCIEGEPPIGALWVVAEWDGYFHQGHAQTVTELATFACVALKMTRDEQRLRCLLDEQEILAREMSHRLKNVFAMTDGMIHASARHSSTVDDMAKALTGRLHALAKAHSFVERRVSALDDLKVADLGVLIASVTRVHDEAGDTSRVRIEGPPVDCGGHAANSLVLMFHELTTNAAKYGALSGYAGRLDITWRQVDDDIVLIWREQGGPPVSPAPRRKGFGSTLVARTLQLQFKGEANYDWVAGGLVLTLRFAADAFTC